MKMIGKCQFILFLTVILTVSVTSIRYGNTYFPETPGGYSNEYSREKCHIPKYIYEIPLDKFIYDGARGFYQTIVDVPYFVNTDLKCLTLHYHDVYRGKAKARQTAQTISTTYRLEDHLTITELRPGVFESRSRNTPSLVVIEYVIEHNRHYSICSTCIYHNDRFLSQTAGLVSSHRFVHPVTVEEAMHRAGIRFYSRFDISQTQCRYNNNPRSYGTY